MLREAGVEMGDEEDLRSGLGHVSNPDHVVSSFIQYTSSLA